MKPLFDFNRSSAIPSGYRSACRECEKNDWRNMDRTGWSRAYRHTTRGRAISLHGAAKKRAKEKGLDFDITIDWVEQRLITGVCEVTGIPFEKDDAVERVGRSFAPSLDRRDNALGYTQDNVQVVCWIYNRAKGVQGAEDVLRMAEALCLSQ